MKVTCFMKISENESLNLYLNTFLSGIYNVAVVYLVAKYIYNFELNRLGWIALVVFVSITNFPFFVRHHKSLWKLEGNWTFVEWIILCVMSGILAAVTIEILSYL